MPSRGRRDRQQMCFSRRSENQFESKRRKSEMQRRPISGKNRSKSGDRLFAVSLKDLLVELSNDGLHELIGKTSVNEDDRIGVKITMNFFQTMISSSTIDENTIERPHTQIFHGKNVIFELPIIAFEESTGPAAIAHLNTNQKLSSNRGKRAGRVGDQLLHVMKPFGIVFDRVERTNELRKIQRRITAAVLEHLVISIQIRTDQIAFETRNRHERRIIEIHRRMKMNVEVSVDDREEQTGNRDEESQHRRTDRMSRGKRFQHRRKHHVVRRRRRRREIYK